MSYIWDTVRDWDYEPPKDAWIGNVVGVTFVDGYPKSLISLASKVPVSAVIKRNPNNRYDSNACEVWVEGKMIGHLAKDVAAELAPQLDSGVEYEMTIRSIGFANGDMTKPGASYWIKKKG